MSPQLKNDNLGTRMKSYEVAVGSILIPRMPTIIRVDGKAFHTFTRRINETNDPSSVAGPSKLMNRVMMNTTEFMCRGIQNVALAYTQSDEISFLLRDYDKLESQQWFGGKVQKIASVSAAMAATYFNYFWQQSFPDQKPETVRDLALFDSRVFQIPKEDVSNYFIWRQKDATRNSINFIARKFFSHAQLQGKNTNEIQEMLWSEMGINWNNYATWEKRGSCVIPTQCDGSSTWYQDLDIPIFTLDRNRKYIEDLLDLTGVSL